MPAGVGLARSAGGFIGGVVAVAIMMDVGAREGRAASTRQRGTVRPPADGERTAVEGFGGQYKFAALMVLRLADEVESVRVADPEAGAVDDFAIFTPFDVHAIQVKWPEFGGTLTLNALCAIDKMGRGVVRDLATGWRDLVKRESDQQSGRRVTVYFVTRDYVSKTKETISGTAAPRHAAAFFKYGIVPVQKNLQQGADTPPSDLVTPWKVFFDALQSAAGLASDLEFWGFIRDVRFEFGASDRVDFLAGFPRQTRTISDDANELAAYFFTQVSGIADDRRKTVHIAAEDLWKALNWQRRHWLRGRQQFPVPLAYVPNLDSRSGS